MNHVLIPGLFAEWMVIAAVCWLSWQLLRQNGRILLRLEKIEKRLEQADSVGEDETATLPLGSHQIREGGEPPDEGDRANRFGNRSLGHSRIKRDGLKAGTAAPDFGAPRLDGGEFSLAELRGQIIFLVFSSPHCDPCNVLAPRLEKFQREHPQLRVLMVSRGEVDENREKVRQHGLTFRVVLQKQWEVSRLYAMFASPVAYLIDAAGIINADVAVGVDAVQDLMARAERLLRPEVTAPKLSVFKRLAEWPVSLAVGSLNRILSGLGTIRSKLDNFELKHFKYAPRPDDIFIVTYPRSGTTWMQMILYQLTTDGSMDIPHISARCPWFEHSLHSDQGFEDLPAPRVFKSHLPYHQIPKGPARYIYVARDGRDVALSYYHMYCSHNGYQGTLAEFFDLFMHGNVIFGSWFKHVGGWWKHRHELNVLFLSYEELVRDLEGCLRRVIAFCHLEVPEEKLPLIIERCSFAFMKEHENKFDPAVEVLLERGTKLNSFLRTGRVGEGARQLEEEQKARFDEAFQAQLESTGFAWPGAALKPTPELAAA